MHALWQNVAMKTIGLPGGSQHPSMSSDFITCVGAVVSGADSLLAVRQAKGHPLEGQWTIPWGRLEPGESPASAALREVKEESGIVAAVTGLIGVQELPEPWLGSFALVYHCDRVNGDPTPDFRETDAAAFLTMDQIRDSNEPFEPWSRWLMIRVLNGEHSVTLPARSNPYSPQIGFL